MQTIESTYTQESSSLVETKQGLLPWIVCFSAALFFFYEFIQMNVLNSLGSYIVRDYGLTATQLGSLSAWYFYATVMFLLVSGSLLDRFSTRKIILAGLGFCVIGTFFWAVSESLFVMAACRFFAGIGSAFCFLSCMRLASRWFPAHRLAFVIGLIVTIAMFGGVIAQTPLIILADTIGWRASLVFNAILGGIITLVVWRFVKDYPAEQQGNHRAEQQQLQALGFWTALRKAFLKRQNWLGGIYTCLLNLPVSLLGALWGNTYLQQVNHLSATQASYVTTMIFLGIVMGGPLVGWISDRIQLRRLPMAAGAILSLSLILTIIYIPNLSMQSLLVLFFLLGVTSSTQIISYPTIAESNPKILTATSNSVVSITTIGGYAIFQPLFGRMMDWHWSGQMHDHVRVYSTSDYHFAIMVMPIAFVIGLIAAWALKETHCKPVD